ncbi:hypothetical protein AB7M17_001470 [Bradyrhizobium sp. USDA 377]
MASLRFRNGKWQVQVRRHGHSTRAKSFQSKSDAQRWARQIEAELDRTLIPNDVRSLNTITVAQLLTRYRDTVTNEKRGIVPERKRKGLNTAEVASISGHRDLRTLFRYTHLKPEDLVTKLRNSKALAA